MVRLLLSFSFVFCKFGACMYVCMHTRAVDASWIVISSIFYFLFHVKVYLQWKEPVFHQVSHDYIYKTINIIFVAINIILYLYNTVNIIL